MGLHNKYYLINLKRKYIQLDDCGSVCFLRPSIFWYSRFPRFLAYFRYFTIDLWRFCYFSGSYSSYWGLVSFYLFLALDYLFLSYELFFSLVFLACSCLFFESFGFFSFLFSSASCYESSCYVSSISSAFIGDIFTLFYLTFVLFY
jgi:hypothetical protein